MKKLWKWVLALIVCIIVLFIVIVVVGLSGPSNNEDLKEIEIKEGSSYLTISGLLKENDLIRSELLYKVYVKITNPKPLEAGKYQLSENMGVKGIIEVFEKGNTYNPDAVTFQVPEGKTLEQVAETAASVTNLSKEELMEVWDRDEFVDEVINKYWFVTEDVKDSEIRHPLEGYLFPSTYELLNKDVSAEYIAYKMLDQMELVLNKYKEDIENSDYSVHELLTMASIVEYETILDSDRPIVAGVFYNRLDDDMKLQSCATLGYAIDEWKLTYTLDDMNTDSRYNTYYYYGLPVGPGGMPSEESIEAAIYPETHNYYYFMANVCDPTSQKTYFAETLAEHEANVDKYLTCF